VLDAVELLLADEELATLTPEQQRTVVRLQDLAQQARDSVFRHRVS
jgi:ABC-type phosphate/phosphonate transport system ATPase subunit